MIFSPTNFRHYFRYLYATNLGGCNTDIPTLRAGIGESTAIG